MKFHQLLIQLLFEIVVRIGKNALDHDTFLIEIQRNVAQRDSKMLCQFGVDFPCEFVAALRHMFKSFGPTKALVDVELEVNRGEIRGLIGENGSGKSTISSIVAGVQPYDSGEMFFKGEPYKPTSMIEAQAKGIAMVVQEMGTISNITVAANIFIGKEKLLLKYWHTCQQKNDMARENSLAWSNRSMQSTSCSDTRFPRGIGVVRKESEERT